MHERPRHDPTKLFKTRRAGRYGSKRAGGYMKYIITALILIIIGFWVLIYITLKQHDKASRSGSDPRHDEVDEEVIRKIRGGN